MMTSPMKSFTTMPQNLKSEIRNPKSEGNPKSEIRKEPRIRGNADALEPCCAVVGALRAAWLARAAFGFRISDFLRISDFGFRISFAIP